MVKRKNKITTGIDVYHEPENKKRRDEKEIPVLLEIEIIVGIYC